MRGVLALLGAAALATAGPASANTEADRAELLRLQAQQRTAHLTYDADLLVSASADPLVSIDGGRVSRSNRAEQLAMVQNYFGAVRFVAWEDAAPPQITMSDDGSMAVIVVQKRVALVGKGRRPRTRPRRKPRGSPGWRPGASKTGYGAWC